MMTEEQLLNLPTDTVMIKPAEPQIQMNSQGERIEVPIQKPIETQAQPAPTLGGNFDDVISLDDTLLAPPSDALCPPTDDTGMEHKIISCGHVLKSTHDLARWSEKTGARRVNQQESIDSVSDLAINLEANINRGPRRNNNTNNTNRANNNADPAGDIRGLFGEGGNNRRGARRNGPRAGAQRWKPVEGMKSEVINCWPVLKSTHDQAQLSEKRGRNAVNKAECSEALDELALNQQQGQQGGKKQSGGEQSAIVNSWPVLKSTHDMATWSEKRGAHAVNDSAGAAEVLDDLALNQQQGQQGQQQQSGGEQSTILHSWPVLKSTHDQATWSEKRGANRVNAAGAGAVLEEVAQNQGAQQAGGSLQSGMDTQAASHVQLDSNQTLTETPEQVTENLHVHV